MSCVRFGLRQIRIKVCTIIHHKLGRSIYHNQVNISRAGVDAYYYLRIFGLDDFFDFN